MHAENCVVLRVTARGNQTRGKDASEGGWGGREEEGGGGRLAVAARRGEFHMPSSCCVFYTFHIRPAHMPQAGACLCVEGCGVGFARRAVRKYVANSTAH